MKDSFNRDINYLRLALTDRCNLRCIYCQPVGGIPVMPQHDLLTPDEIERIVKAAVALGFHKFRLTGGEPTLRDDLVEIVGRLAHLPGVQELVMTTNGARISNLAVSLARAGLQRVNIHLDSLRETSLTMTMPFNSLAHTALAIQAMERAGLIPIKINAVVVRGYNDEAVLDLARLTMNKDWHVRFIELIPFGEMSGVALNHFVSSRESMGLIESQLGPLIPLHEGNLVGEARLYRLTGGKGVIGFISPVSAPYCKSCSRMRMTADGKLRPCLLSDQAFDIRSILRGGGSQAALEMVFKQAILAKPEGGYLQLGEFPKQYTMAQVGG
jgi:cyclic pyranopterin phosphate synthase